MANIKEFSGERSCDDDWILLEEAEPNFPLSFGVQQVDNDGEQDDDFFEILRLRQSTSEEASMESRLNETVVDSTPSMMVLVDTQHHNRDDIPDLISNISPTSLSTTTSSEEKENTNSTPTYDNSESKEIVFSFESEIISKLTKPSNYSSYITRSGFLLRFSLLIVFLLSGAVSIYSNTSTFQLSKNITTTLFEYWLDLFDAMKEERILFNIFGNYQEDSQRFPFHSASEIPVEGELQNGTTYFDVTKTQQQHQFVHHAPNHLIPQKSDQADSTTETNPPDEEALEQEHTFDWEQWKTEEMEQLPQQCNTIQNEISTSLPSKKEEAFLPSKSKSTIDIQLNNISHYLQQMANDFATTTSELAKYANGIFDELASKNAEIRASKLSMVGDQDPLIHIWEAAKIIVSGIIRQVSDIVGRVNKVLDDLATKNAEIHSSKLSIEGVGETLVYQLKRKLSTGNGGMQTSDIIDMKGVRESFTKMRSSIRKETSRMLSREIKSISMMVLI